MKEPLYKINDNVETDFGPCCITDVHISPTTSQVVYEGRTLENRTIYPLFREEDVYGIAL